MISINDKSFSSFFISKVEVFELTVFKKEKNFVIKKKFFKEKEKYASADNPRRRNGTFLCEDF